MLVRARALRIRALVPADGLRAVMAYAKALNTVDLPLSVSPTSMRPWRTDTVSYSCRHLSMNDGSSCSL